MNKTALVAMFVAALSATGCSNLTGIKNSKPGVESELVRVVGIETPSRVTVLGNGYHKYFVDLAYLQPSTVPCNEKICSAIKDAMVGKKFWVQHEYDRAGLYMYSFWPAGKRKSAQPINIDLIVYGGYARMSDYMALPNGKSELIARATEVGAANEKLGARVKGLKHWQKTIIGKGDNK